MTTSHHDLPTRSCASSDPAVHLQRPVAQQPERYPARALERLAALDLTAAATVVGRSEERARWLEEMQQPGGMTPGASSLAHARAFRFAAALRGAGYRVSEAPLGPRGGRRFTLDGYDGPRCGAIYRLQTHRGCSFWHRREECGCFADLSDQELSLVATLHRKIKKTSGTIYTTDRIADLVRTQDETALRTAVDLYVRADTALMGGPDLETYLFLLEGCPTDTLRLAIGLFKAAGGTRRGGPTVSDYVGLLGRYDLDTLQAAVHLFLSSEGSGDGLPFADLIAALQAARS